MRQTPLTCSGHTRPVVDLAFSDTTADGCFLISACKDGKPMLRLGDTGDWVGTFEGHKGAVWGATLNKNATLAATGAADFTAKVWNAVTGDEMHTFSHKHIVKSVCFSDDSRQLLTGSNEKILRVYDLERFDAEPEQISGHTATLRACVFLPGNKLLASAADDKTLRLWDTVSKQQTAQVDLDAVPTSLEISRDGLTLTTTQGSDVAFWHAQTLQPIRKHEIPTRVNSASLHPDNSTFVCGGEDFKMYKCDYVTGAELESFKGHFGPVHCVRFSPDGEVYATGSEDGTLRLWQTNVGKTYGLWRSCPDDDQPTAGDQLIRDKDA